MDCINVSFVDGVGCLLALPVDIQIALPIFGVEGGLFVDGVALGVDCGAEQGKDNKLRKYFHFEVY